MYKIYNGATKLAKKYSFFVMRPIWRWLAFVVVVEGRKIEKSIKENVKVEEKILEKLKK